MKSLLYKIPTSGKPAMLELNVMAKDYAKFGVRGYDPTKPFTVYFSREIEIKKPQQVFSFSLPVSPLTNLVVELKPIIGEQYQVRLQKKPLKKLSRKRFSFPKKLNGFIKHAIEFSTIAGFTPTGLYTNDQDQYPIYLQEQIIDAKGYPVDTPSRVNIETGEIIVKRDIFQSLSIPIRVNILLHEYMHHYHQTFDEAKADYHAQEIYLELGFPKYEAILAQGKIFWDSPEMIRRLQQTQKNILNYQE
ncbi:hypothetical protein BKI52_02680 [marine bacterium AO1-C]|nr:hypothetical protein BKI52_02680 [marine bacterium AO1-C]